MAKTLVGDGVIHSTDTLIEATGDYRAFFKEMQESNNFTNLNRMHSKNLVEAKKSMEAGITPVIVDNTNIKANEAKMYVTSALVLGYADENIKIVDVGTGGLDAQALAERNTHGVPIEKIRKMIDSHKSVGPLTLKMIMESKDMYKDSDVLYSAVLLDAKSRSELLAKHGYVIPENWKTIAHHMTIAFGKGIENKAELGRTVALTVQKIGISDMAIAVAVNGYPSKNAIPHITLAVNPEGGKPVMSNQIENWYTCEWMELTGTVVEIKKTK